MSLNFMTINTTIFLSPLSHNLFWAPYTRLSPIYYEILDLQYVDGPHPGWWEVLAVRR